MSTTNPKRINKAGTVAGEGHVLLQLFDENGQEKTRREGHNMVVQRGMISLARRIWSSPNTSTGPRRVQYMQLGTSGTVESTLQTDLIAELTTPGTRATATITQLAVVTGRTVQWQHTWTASVFSATGIEEVGLFNSPTLTKGTMFARFVSNVGTLAA